jgi:hypothetical protein
MAVTVEVTLLLVDIERVAVQELEAVQVILFILALVDEVWQMILMETLTTTVVVELVVYGITQHTLVELAAVAAVV